ncbi:hypothetical protein ONS95_007524 [Cadophora gregata]|uniref:uncharacterized protein n=1 Tax=Cadophora gregata TaxID=51156 RepID=UPI0026DCC5CF|nr:uncharacterized protein ONS95_007524 [Cadophora gregata]KAK0118643.1 hypothetical protein ONS96_011731 [Cadophora gregata f. sp. sojae]KAK0125900.1 hypothetical protein ONS95_007524 [Cadophora gregata]
MMDSGFRPGILPISQTDTMTSKYMSPALEASPFLLGAFAATLWEAFLPGPDRFEHFIDYTWCVPRLFMISLVSGYLFYHGTHRRYQWYPIAPLTRAYLDITRTYSSCYILGLIGISAGFKMIFVMVSYMDPYDNTSKIPTANCTIRVVLLFFVLAYSVLGLGVCILVSKPLGYDRKRLRILQEGYEVMEG